MKSISAWSFVLRQLYVSVSDKKYNLPSFTGVLIKHAVSNEGNLASRWLCFCEAKWCFYSV